MIIEPFLRIGDLHFNDSRKEIRIKINESHSEGLNEFQGIKDYYDYFLNSEIKVYYDEENSISAFEFYKGPLTFNGIDLLTESYENLVKLFCSLDSELKVEETGFTSRKCGIGIEAVYAAIEDQTAPAESVIVFKKGYYDKLDQMSFS
jgi:hypothetical protein